MKFNIVIRLLLVICVVHLSATHSSGLGIRQQIDSLNNLLLDAKKVDSIELLTEKGRLYFKNDDNIKAVESFYQALKLADEVNDNQKKATLVNNIAAIQYNTGDLEAALANFTQSYELEMKLDNRLGVSKSLNNMAIVYNELERFDESLDFYNKSLTIREELGDSVGIATIHNNMGLVFIKKKDYERAINHYQKSLKISIAHQNNKSVANTYANIARAYLFLKEYQSAIEYIDKSFQFIDNESSVFIKRDNYLTLYEIYKEMNNHKLALENYEKYDAICDSLNVVEINANLNELKLRFESEKNERENIMLKSERDQQKAFIQTQNIIVISIAVVLLLLSVLTFLMYKNALLKKKSIARLQRQKDEIEEKNLELRKLNQIKNKIFSVISHEVRSPLGSLLGTVELLTSGYLSPEEFFELSSDLKQKVNQTTIFLNNILLWAKSQMHGMTVNREDFVVNDLVNDMVDILIEQAVMKGVEIERNINEKIFVKADRNMIGIVIKNLIANAIKFTEKGNKVTIDAVKNGKFAVVNVSDHGVGISKENQQKIFGSESISTKGTAQEVGTGLGLTLSKSFVEENGGKIWVESTEGQGSTFSFSVPLN